ncbi:MAG: L-2-amino-thiazoline-4-carboxylic acid hydrolase [Armatimonadota bacterium]|nr:L-2-amino-thiazoline-4-carboxylic acid hydrolase [Armatimonadota bacterium]
MHLFRMAGGLRPHRVQKQACRAAVAAVLGEEAADELMLETGIAGLSDLLPDGPRDLAALSEELQPFVDLYRAVAARTGRDVALAAARQAIVRSAIVGFASEDEALRREVAGGQRPAEPRLNLTGPPPAGFRVAREELQRRFAASLRFFSCEGQLLEYTPERVRFSITDCNWVRAMQRAGAPELAAFFCESDERFADGHPTHRLERPTAIGLGHASCEFRFVPRGEADAASGGTSDHDR